ncbi:hypothetical protein D3C78_1762590 [compost metagenome]
MIGGFHCKEPIAFHAITKEGTVYDFSSENAPLLERKSIGKAVASIDKKDEIVDLVIRA